MTDRVAKKFYDSLAEKKIYGVKCGDCSAWTFPPKSACQQCGSQNISWQQISGEGMVHYYSTSILPPAKFAEYAPYAYGNVILKEGPAFFTMIEGLDASTPEKIREGNEKLPLPVKAKIAKKAGMNIVLFKVVKKK